MKIQFDKIGSTQKPFKHTNNKLSLTGTLKKSGYHQISLKATLFGEISLECDRCGDAYIEKIDNQLSLSIVDQISKDKEDLDIIEFLDGIIDVGRILESEVNIHKSLYSYCDKCKDSEETLEIEF